ncbi:universal stress protein [Streptomyces griseorubiginosus]|uniref:universal stress protein n=1 Tax=Streptomyces griseorubiginosus TaxID=67304 RepID=UPI003660C45D
MTGSGVTGPVVVGLDGSPASVTAAWWAARTAVEQRLPVLLLHSWTTQPVGAPIAQEALGKQRYGGEVLEGMEAELLQRHDDLKVTTELVSAPASKALADLGGTAAPLVLGSRGHGSIASFFLGSVSLYVLGLARCPVVAVRAEDTDDDAERYEIVVGVQEAGAASDPLLEFGFTAAEARGGRECARSGRCPCRPWWPIPVARIRTRATSWTNRPGRTDDVAEPVVFVGRPSPASGRRQERRSGPPLPAPDQDARVTRPKSRPARSTPVTAPFASREK